jgi:hypothetical protein
MSPAKYELGFYIPEDDSLYNHRRENLKSYSFSVIHKKVNTATELESNACRSSHYQNRNRCCKMSDVSGGLRLSAGEDKGHGGIVITGFISEDEYFALN